MEMKTFIVLFALILGCLAAKTKPKKVKIKKVNPAHQAKIVNGKMAQDGEFPFQVSLQINGDHHCGATVLSTEYVLTAAHCIFNIDLNDLTVKAGTNSIIDGGSVHKVVDAKHHKVVDAKHHWQFKDVGIMYYDIAVLKVSPPFKLSSKVQPVTLPPENSEPAAGATSVAIGWGAPCVGCNSEPNLQKVKMRIYSLDECITSLRKNLPTDIVCASGFTVPQGVCFGDSGGPLLLEGVQVGITSWGFQPCGTNFQFWTKVSRYRSWIKANTGV